MGATTGISWTDHTANFWWGCQRVSPGCEHCYAETLAVTRRKLDVWGPPSTTERKRIKGIWSDVPKWNAAAKADGVRRRLFVSSMADVFEAHPQVAPWRAEALDLLAQCDGLDVQMLTKRPENIRAMVPPAWLESWPAHVWVGTTVEDQRRANERIPHLLDVPTPVKFLSCEPLLEDVRLGLLRNESGYPADCECGHGHGFTRCPNYGGIARRCHVIGCACAKFTRKAGSWNGISQVIVGGESGPDARVFRLEWARSIIDQCRKADVAVFVKQLGAVVDSRLPEHEEWPGHSFGVGPVQFMGDGFGNYRVRGLKHRAGGDPAEWPAEFRAQEFPAVSR